MTILISDKTAFKKKINRQRYFTIIKRPIQQKDITIIHIHTLQNRVPKHMKGELKGEIDNSKI